MLRCIFIALSKKGWGEAILGRRIAIELVRRGCQVVFAGHESLSVLFSGGEVPFEPIPEHLGPLAPMYLAEVITQFAPDRVILSDFVTCEQVLNEWGSSVESLVPLIPLSGIDTWDSELTGERIDIFQNKIRRMPAWPLAMERLRPVPFGALRNRSGLYSNIPSSLRTSRKQSNHLRASLGVDKDTKLVLLTTALWQQTDYKDENGDRISARVPELIDYYLSKVGTRAHLIHIGPARFAMPMIGERYHWFPQLSADRFTLLLGTADLLLSLNVSASTIAAALANGTPVIVLQNSVVGNSLDEVGAGLELRSDFVKEWVVRTVPVFKFRLWPLGFYDFLAPIVDQSSYVRAIQLSELLDEESSVSGINDLLYNPAVRFEKLEAASEFCAAVRTLPSGVELINLGAL